MSAPLPIVVLISGRGSNMRALAEQAAQGTLQAEIRAVISDQPTAQGLQIAQQLQIPTESLTTDAFSDRRQFDAALATRVQSYQPKLVVLAGYMRILGGAFVRAFTGRLINIHPSLLPQYPGLHTHRRVLQAGDAEHGASVHFVTEELDAGPLIIQGRVPVMKDDTEASLSARVQRIEHIIYPRAVQLFAQERIAMRDGLVWLDDRPLHAPIVEHLNSEPTS